MATMAIQLLVPHPAIGETLTPEINPPCQQIELPGNKELVDFKSMRARYSMEKYSGINIRTIHIVNLPVFNLHDPEENYALYRFINSIHTPTQYYVIRRQLLFKEGEVLNPRLLAESERILRRNSYFSDAVVLPHQRCGDALDLIVVVRDLWTLLPKFYLSRKGGNNKYGLTLENENVLGSGNTLYLEFINERERDTQAVGYSTKQLFGTRITLDAVYSDTTDGINKKLEVQRPFYALDTPWSLGAKFNERIFEESLEAFNQDINTFEHIKNEYQISAGYSRGLIEGFSQRYSFGFSRTEDIFAPVDNTSTIPTDRILAYPWVQYSIIEDNFAIYRNLNALYRTEDVPIGADFSTLLGYADDTFDSELSQWVFSLSYSNSPLTLDRHLIRAKLEVDGFWDRDINDFVNTVSSIDLSYFWLMAEKQRMHVGLSYDHGTNLTQDQLLPLGGDEGLRGYPSEYLLGEQRFLVNLEHRYFFDAHYLNLFRFASVIFFDMGQTMYSKNTVGEDSELLTSAGVGIRINSSKTNISRIIHIDLALPLNDKDQLGDYQFRITSNSTF